MSDDGQRYGVMSRGGRARRHERRARRGRRDRQLAHRQVHPRGQDPRRLHLRGPRADRRGGGDPPRDVPRRARRLAAVRPAHGRGLRRSRRSPSGAREGLPFYGETLSAYLSFTQDDLWDESPDRGRRQDLQRARRCSINNYPTPKFGPDRDTCWEAIADDRLQVVGHRPRARQASRTASRRWARPSTTMQAGQAGGRAAGPAAVLRGRGQGPLQRQPLGRADLRRTRRS